MSANQSITQPPRYELQSVFSDETQTPPRIVPVNELSWDTTGMSRRNFLGAGLTAVAALVLLQTGCASSKSKKSVPRYNPANCNRHANCGFCSCAPVYYQSHNQNS